MSDFLIRYGSILEPQDELCSDEAVALARIVELYEAGEKASLWQELPVKLTAKARIIKRKTSAPETASGVEPPSSPVASPAADSVCGALKCEEPCSTASDYCRAHKDALAGGVKFPHKAKAALRAKEAGPLVPHG